VTRPLFSVVVLTRAQKEIDSADLWWSEHRENPDAVRDEFRKFCELVVVFPEIGTLVASSRVAARRVLLPDIEYPSTIAFDPERIASKYSASGMRGEERVRECSRLTRRASPRPVAHRCGGAS
jgi:hypothetical protein